MLHASDAKWWRYYAPQVAGFKGERWTIDPEFAGDPDMHQIEGVNETGISPNPKRIFTNGNGGAQAIGLATLWGASKIVLLGFDMQPTGGKLHFHKDHPEKPLGNPGNWDAWQRRMLVVAADLRRLGVECVNASRETSLKCFERVDIGRALV